jgi:predicted RNase H-like HicB family nuclease
MTVDARKKFCRELVDIARFLLTQSARCRDNPAMRQQYHTIFRPELNGWFVGWVEEVPGTITHGRSLEECRQNLRHSLATMIETYRDEARSGLTDGCIQEALEIDVDDHHVLEQMPA